MRCNSLVMPLGGCEIIDERQQVARSAGFGHVRRELAVDDHQGHALDVVALGELLCALQIRCDREGVVGCRELVRADAVFLGEGELRLQSVVIARGHQHLMLLLDGIECLLQQVLTVQRDQRVIELARAPDAPGPT